MVHEGKCVRTRSFDHGPSEALKRNVAELEKTRKITSRKKGRFFVKGSSRIQIIPRHCHDANDSLCRRNRSLRQAPHDGIPHFMMSPKTQELLERQIKQASVVKAR